ncbi:MAG TPA: LON peptidase substrate-binding domain-containing protein [Acidimicrobiia bacterium]|nr:LON peptidase substrate-binding domain-containing protein [Acidimicrobiia bacterium]
MSGSPERLAMFPLGTVIFPYSGVPLRVFEPRYVVLLEAVLSDQNTFGSVLIERGFEVGGGDVRSAVGTRLRVLAHQDLPDGHHAILVAGVERIRVIEWLEDDPHPWAVVEPFPDVDGEVIDLRAGVCSRLERMLAMASELGADTADVDLDVGEDPVAMSYQLAALVPVTALDSYALLCAPGPRERMQLAAGLLDDQIELIRLRLSGS